MTYPAYSTAGFERHVVRVDGIDTVYYAIGTGPTVVVLHGGGTFTGFEWAREWARDLRVLLPHHPNFGESGDADFGTVADYAAHYARVFDTLGLERFHLLGASMGGAIAVEFAALRPECLERVVLVTPAGLTSPAVPPPDFSGVAPEDVPGYFVRDREFIEPYWPRNPGVELQALLARERAAAARVRDFSQAGDRRMRRLVGSLHAPTLILWGEDDRVLRIGLLDEWRRELPQAEVHVVPGGSHLLLDEFKEARDRALAFFVLSSCP